MAKGGKFFEELKRRNAFRAAAAYAIVAWIVLQVAEVTFLPLGVPAWVMTGLIVLAITGFPITIAVSWIYEWTPGGIMTDEAAATAGYTKSAALGRQIDFVIIALMAVAIGYFVWDKFVDVPGVPQIRSLAVLPLENLSGDPEQEYFTDGMTDALITSLAKVGALRVVSRTSVMRFKDTDKSLREIAAELGVDAIIEGSAIRDGDRIRITAQLIDAGTDHHLWAESYDRDFRDVLILQNEIAKTIAQEVKLTLTPEETIRLGQAAMVSPDGYDAYLKGMQHYYRLTPHDLETALQYFEFSLEQNPNSALAYTGIAAVWGGRQQMGFAPSSEAAPKARAAALRALEVDPDLAEAHSRLASIRVWSDWNWAGGEQEFRRAIEINPSFAGARALYSHLLAILGRSDEALIQIELALELDPFNGFFQAFYGVVLQMNRRYDAAIAAFEGALRISPNLPFAWFAYTGSLHVSGRFEEAVAAEGSLLAALGDTNSQRIIMQTYQERGYEEAMGWAADLAAERSVATGSGGAGVAGRYSRAGHEDKVIEWLERAYDQRDPNLPYLLMPEFDSVRSDPRVQELMRRMNLL